VMTTGLVATRAAPSTSKLSARAPAVAPGRARGRHRQRGRLRDCGGARDVDRPARLGQREVRGSARSSGPRQPPRRRDSP
jgi:hypothetical protein